MRHIPRCQTIYDIKEFFETCGSGDEIKVEKINLCFKLRKYIKCKNKLRQNDKLLAV